MRGKGKGVCGRVRERVGKGEGLRGKGEGERAVDRVQKGLVEREE